MKKHPIARVTCGIAAVIVAGSISANAQLALQLKASNYNPITGVWTDSSGNNDTATFINGTTPTLASGVTPNGSSAVDIVGSNASYGVGSNFNLANPITGGSGYTVFAYILPSTVTGGRHAITGGSTSYALEYNLYSGNQTWLSEYQGGGGTGSGTISTSSFSLIDLTASTSSGAFRLNGAADGTTGGTAGGNAFTPITQIGNNEGGGDFFSGYIAEVDVYQGVLSSSQIGTVEASIIASYVTPVPEPTALSLTAGGLALLVVARRFRRFQS